MHFYDVRDVGFVSGEVTRLYSIAGNQAGLVYDSV